MRPNRNSIDEDSASRLLQGLVHPDDAPPGYSAVAGLLNAAARLPLGPVDEDAAASTVSAMVEVIRDAAPAPQLSRRKAMLGKLLAGKALAAFAVVGLSATGAAAATGSLPDQAQAVVSDAAGHVGLNIPHPNHGKSAAHRQDKNNKPSGDDEAPSGDDQGEGSDISTWVHDNKATVEGPFGQEVCQQASNNKCHSGAENPGQGGGDDETTTHEPQGPKDDRGQRGEHGKPADTPAQPTTPAGSIDTGAQHSERELPSGKGKPE